MSDPRQGSQPSQEEMRAYVEQLRAAEASEIIAQAFTMLGTGAEVKLGRPDARVLIDAVGALVEAVGERIDADLAESMRSGVAQLRSAQVQAEQQTDASEPAGSGAEGSAGEDTGAGAASSDAQGATGGGRQRQSAEQQRRMTDRLWIPGRDEPPSPR